MMKQGSTEEITDLDMMYLTKHHIYEQPTHTQIVITGYPLSLEITLLTIEIKQMERMSQ